MKNFVGKAAAVIQAHQLRLTSPRKMLIAFLDENTSPMTPYEIRDLLKSQGQKADVVTIYRILDEFEKIGLVHKVMTLGRYVRCDEIELEAHCEKDDDCHHYLICENCHKVEEISGENLHDLEKVIATQMKFRVKRHFLEFLGLCSKCKK